MMSIQIRLATKEDMVHVLALIKELAVFEKEPDAVIVDEDYLISHGFSANPSFTCYVGEYQNQIVGMALFYYRFSTWKGKTIHLEDLIVKEDKRGLGIGKLLYDKVLECAYKEKVKRVEWVVLDWNTHAVDFYERSGAKVLDDWRTVQMDDIALEKYFTGK